MNPSAFPKVIEYLRQGVPPYGMSSHFTVGDSNEVRGLELLICSQGPHLIEADGGCGKSHLLDHIREKALEQGFAVSLVKIDSERETRFNCLDQIVGAVFRGLEIPQVTNQRGIRPFMKTLCQVVQDSRFSNRNHDFWSRLTNDWTWDSDVHKVLESPAVYIALRAWCFGGNNEQSLVEDWLGHPWRYYKDRKRLVRTLIEDLSSHFVDPRTPSVLFSNKARIFHFREPGYVQSWAALSDIRRLAMAAGFKGLVLLFDEMDDIYHKLGNLKFQKIALANLFRFLQPDFFSGKSFFAVDSDFENKCRHEFIKKRQGDYDLSPLEKIPRFRMSVLDQEDLLSLASKIVRVYSVAYGWTDNTDEAQQEVESVVRDVTKVTTGHTPRQVIRAVVEHLDENLEGRQ